MIAVVAKKSTPSLFIFSRNWSITKWLYRRSIGGGVFRCPLHPTLFVNKFQRLQNNQTSNFDSQYWMASCGHGRNLSSKAGNTKQDDEKVMVALDQLQFVNRLHMNQISLPLDTADAAAVDHFVPVLLFEVRCKKHRHLFQVDFQRGQKPADFHVNVYTSNRDCFVATMKLEPKVHQPKTLALQVFSPPGQLVGSVFEIAEMSRIVVVLDEYDQVVFQLLSDCGFGWSSVAKVLKSRGETKIGKIYRMKNKVISNINQPAAGPTCLRYTIHFPKHISACGKINLIGACFVLMGQSPYFPNKTS